jgi:hypothetical protein
LIVRHRLLLLLPVHESTPWPGALIFVIDMPQYRQEPIHYGKPVKGTNHQKFAAADQVFVSAPLLAGDGPPKKAG